VAMRPFLNAAATPPFQGGEYSSFPFIHSFIDRPYPV
jgi:hypothetical protein